MERGRQMVRGKGFSKIMSSRKLRPVSRAVSRAAMLGVLLLAAGCASIHDHRGYIIDQSLLDSVQPGIDNRMSVERTLGKPTFASQFGDQVWYYVAVDTRQVAFRLPRPVNETILRVRFDPQGNVLGVDRAGMEHVVHIRPDGKVTPTLGKRRSFLEDLFGNIGAVGAAGMGGGQQGGAPGTGPNGS